MFEINNSISPAAVPKLKVMTRSGVTEVTSGVTSLTEMKLFTAASGVASPSEETVMFSVCPSPVLVYFFGSSSSPSPVVFYLYAEITDHKIPFYVVEKKHEKVREMCPNDLKESPRAERLCWVCFCLIFNELVFLKTFRTDSQC